MSGLKLEILECKAYALSLNFQVILSFLSMLWMVQPCNHTWYHHIWHLYIRMYYLISCVLTHMLLFTELQRHCHIMFWLISFTIWVHWLFSSNQASGTMKIIEAIDQFCWESQEGKNNTDWTDAEHITWFCLPFATDIVTLLSSNTPQDQVWFGSLAQRCFPLTPKCPDCIPEFTLVECNKDVINRTQAVLFI